MKKYTLMLLACFGFVATSLAQVVSVRPYPGSDDSAKYYYITTCEEYKSLTKGDNWHYNNDTCQIDFSRYDLSGVFYKDSIRWVLVHPKKYTELEYKNYPSFDKMQWKVAPYNIVIEDTSAYNKLKLNAPQKITDTFNFSRTVLVCNDVWIDCSGMFYYKILYDKVENKMICNVVQIYGGSAGMCPRYSWIVIDKPRPNTTIEVRTLKIN